MVDAPDLQDLRIERDRSSRRRSSPWPGRLILLLVLAALVWFFQRPLRDLMDRLRLSEVEVVTVIRRSPAAALGAEGAAANGYIVARTRAALSADRPGLLVEVNVQEGSRVTKGQVVARLDHGEQDAYLFRAVADLEVARRTAERIGGSVFSAGAELERRKSEVEASRAAVTEAEAQLEYSIEAERRYDKLLAEGVTHEDARDAVVRDRKADQARLQSAEARLASAVAAVAAAEAELDVARRAEVEAIARVTSSKAICGEAEAALEKTHVRAPFDGIVVLKEAEVGEVVSPNSQGGSNARGSVATMVDFSSLEVQAEVPETSLAAVTLGGRARIYLDAFPEQPYEGRIDRIWPTADRQKATVEVRVAFDQLDERLRPEMGVRVVFLDPGAAQAGESTKRVMLVPVNSLIKQAGASGVFVLERGRVRFQQVRVGAPHGSRVVIEQGLEGEEELVMDPPTDLEDGDRVRVAR